MIILLFILLLLPLLLFLLMLLLLLLLLLRLVACRPTIIANIQQLHVAVHEIFCSRRCTFTVE